MESEIDDESGKSSVSFGNALGWSYVMYGGQYAISSIITFTLAAILGPSAFGLVAMAMVYLAFVQMLLRQGMVPALVQRRQLARRHLDSAFWMVVASGALLAAASLLLANWWANINRTPDLGPVISVMSVIIPLNSLVVVQEAILSRKMDFRGLALRTNSAALAGGVVGLLLAFTGFGVWALVAQHVTRSLVDVIVLWAISDWRPRLFFSPQAAKDILSFSISSTFAGFGEFVNSRADALLIGLFFGPTAVGLYRLAIRLVDLVIEVTVRSLHAVSLPELSRLQDDPEHFVARVANVLNSTALIVLPSLAILAGSAESVMAVLGAEWEAAAGPLAVLCVVGGITALTMFAGPILMAVGRPRVLAGITWVSALLSALSFVFAGILLSDAGIGTQVTGIAIVRLALFSATGIVLAGWAVIRHSPATMPVTLRAVGPAFFSAVASFVITRLLSTVPWVGGAMAQLLIVGALSASATVALMAAIDPGMRALLKRAVPAVLRHSQSKRTDL